MRNRDNRVYVLTNYGVLDRDGNISPFRSNAHRFDAQDAMQIQKDIVIPSRLAPCGLVFEVVSLATGQYVSSNCHDRVVCTPNRAAMLDFHAAVKLAEKLNNRNNYAHVWSARRIVWNSNRW